MILIDSHCFNCSEHMSFLMETFPQHENDEIWLKHKQNELFPKWFKEKVLSFGAKSLIKFNYLFGLNNIESYMCFIF